MDNTRNMSGNASTTSGTMTTNYANAIRTLVQAGNIVFQRGNAWTIQLSQPHLIKGLDVNKTYGTEVDAYRALFQALGLDSTVVDQVVGGASQAA